MIIKYNLDVFFLYGNRKKIFDMFILNVDFFFILKGWFIFIVLGIFKLMFFCKIICEFFCVVELWSFLFFILKYYKVDNSLGFYILFLN